MDRQGQRAPLALRTGGRGRGERLARPAGQDPGAVERRALRDADQIARDMGAACIGLEHDHPSAMLRRDVVRQLDERERRSSDTRHHACLASHRREHHRRRRRPGRGRRFACTIHETEPAPPHAGREVERLVGRTQASRPVQQSLRMEDEIADSMVVATDVLAAHRISQERA